MNIIEAKACGLLTDDEFRTLMHADDDKSGDEYEKKIHRTVAQINISNLDEHAARLALNDAKDNPKIGSLIMTFEVEGSKIIYEYYFDVVKTSKGYVKGVTLRDKKLVRGALAHLGTKRSR